MANTFDISNARPTGSPTFALHNFIEMRGKTALITYHYASILHAFGLSQ
jgi:hypothetical protein